MNNSIFPCQLIFSSHFSHFKLLQHQLIFSSHFIHFKQLPHQLIFSDILIILSHFSQNKRSQICVKTTRLF
jgi:hypothetical protein